MNFIIELLDTSMSVFGTWKEIVSSKGTLTDIEKILDKLRKDGSYYRVIIT